MKEKVNLEFSYDSLPRSNEDSYRLNVLSFDRGHIFFILNIRDTNSALPHKVVFDVINDFCAVRRNHALISGSVHFKVNCASRLARRTKEGILNY